MVRLGAVEGAVEDGGAAAGGFCGKAAGTRSPIVSASPKKMRKRGCTNLFLCLALAILRCKAVEVNQSKWSKRAAWISCFVCSFEWTILFLAIRGYSLAPDQQVSY